MARPIDADALQELCNGRIQDTWNSGAAPVSWAAAYADFKDDIDSMPTLTPPNEWVSVEDTVPDPGERVLATDGIFVGEAYRSSANSWFRHAGFPWRDGVTGRTVRFWMPLPAPPDKGNNVPIKAPNDPLTQADLDSMDYDKVWIDYEDDCGEWALVCNGYIYSIDTLEGAGLDFGDYMRGERLEPHGYKVYRRPTEGEEDT